MVDDVVTDVDEAPEVLELVLDDELVCELGADDSLQYLPSTKPSLSPSMTAYQIAPLLSFC